MIYSAHEYRYTTHEYYLYKFTTPSNKTVIFKMYYDNSLVVEIEDRVVTFKNNDETSEFIKIVKRHLKSARYVIRTAYNTNSFRNCKGFEF